MTVEELLKPRIKCTEPFLGMQRQGWEVGDISTIEENEDYLFSISLPKRFPFNFKLLEWWEYRKNEDIPNFVKCIETPDQIHIPSRVYKIHCLNGIWYDQNSIGVVLSTNCYEPANKSEWLEQVEKMNV